MTDRDHRSPPLDRKSPRGKSNTLRRRPGSTILGPVAWPPGIGLPQRGRTRDRPRPGIRAPVELAAPSSSSWTPTLWSRRERSNVSSASSPIIPSTLPSSARTTRRAWEPGPQRVPAPLGELLKWQRERTVAVEKKIGKIVSPVFHRAARSSSASGARGRRRAKRPVFAVVLCTIFVGRQFATSNAPEFPARWR